MRDNRIMSATHYMVLALGIIGLLSNEMLWANSDEQGQFSPVYSSDNLTVSISEATESPMVKTHLKTLVPNATVDQIKALIFDVANMPDWLGGIKQAAVIERYSEGKQRASLINGMPFPLDDREIVMIQEVMEATPERITIRLTSDYSQGERNPKYVSVEPYQGEWTLLQVGRNVQVELTDRYDAKIGALPQVLVVAHITGAANDTIETLGTLSLQDNR